MVCFTKCIRYFLIGESVSEDRLKRVLDKKQGLESVFNNLPEDNKLQIAKSNPLDEILYSHTRQIDVPQKVLYENRIIAGNRNDPRSISFQILRTQILREMHRKGWNSLAITGAIDGVGKSLVATNLAISISLDVNQTVLLVDFDLRKPTLHKNFGYTPEYGLIDCLVDGVDIKEVLVNPGFKRLTLLPGKGTSNESSEILSSPRTKEIINEMKRKYSDRIILFDLPPLLNIDDAMVFLPNVDAAILVVENGRNTKSEVQKSIALLKATNLIGTVLNKSEEEVKAYI